MKISLPNSKNIFAKKSPKDSNIINPHKHWGILLRVFFIIVLCLIFFSLYLLYKIKKDQIFQVVPTVQDDNVVLKEDLLKKVTESFDKKAQKEKELQTNTPSYPDPSL